MAQKISALPVKAKVRDTKTKYKGATIGWVIGDKNHAGYPASSVTLVSECMLTLKCFDAIESGGGNSRNSYGNNRYIYANIRQWLNKAGTGWYVKQHTYDQPPSNANVWSNYNEYDAEAGFKTGFPALTPSHRHGRFLNLFYSAVPSCDISPHNSHDWAIRRVMFRNRRDLPGPVYGALTRSAICGIWYIKSGGSR